MSKTATKARTSASKRLRSAVAVIADPDRRAGIAAALEREGLAYNQNSCLWRLLFVGGTQVPRTINR
jgi:hypothetical protein